MVDPDDTEGFSTHAIEILSTPQLWQELSDAGRRQAAPFTWQRTARETLAVYQRCCETP